MKALSALLGAKPRTAAVSETEVAAALQSDREISPDLAARFARSVFEHLGSAAASADPSLDLFDYALAAAERDAARADPVLKATEVGPDASVVFAAQHAEVDRQRGVSPATSRQAGLDELRRVVGSACPGAWVEEGARAPAIVFNGGRYELISSEARVAAAAARALRPTPPSSKQVLFEQRLGDLVEQWLAAPGTQTLPKGGPNDGPSGRYTSGDAAISFDLARTYAELKLTDPTSMDFVNLTLTLDEKTGEGQLGLNHFALMGPGTDFGLQVGSSGAAKLTRFARDGDLPMPPTQLAAELFGVALDAKVSDAVVFQATRDLVDLAQRLGADPQQVRAIVGATPLGAALKPTA